MPVIEISIFKQYKTEEWANVYHVNAAGVSDAIPQAQEILAAERTVTAAAAFFSKVLISDGVPNTDNFVILTPNVNGTLAVPPNEILPLFVVARVDFQAASGRNGRKYLRCSLGEVDMSDGGILGSGYKAYVKANYVDPIVTNTDVCKPNGVVFVDGACYPEAAMRQVRRGSKRNTTP